MAGERGSRAGSGLRILMTRELRRVSESAKKVAYYTMGYRHNVAFTVHISRLSRSAQGSQRRSWNVKPRSPGRL